MVKVKIFKDNKNNIVKYVVKGHAGYAAYGKDIFCAAISSVTQAAIVGLTKVLDIKIGLNIKTGYLECILPEGMDSNTREKANIILNTMLFTLKDIQQQYEKYIRIKEVEV